jgi:predicted ATPase
MTCRKYIITGGPGTGKTSIINELTNRGINCYSEVARSVIIQELAAESNALPNKDVLAFTKRVVKIMRMNLNECDKHLLNFFDRGLPDSAGYLWSEGVETPDYLTEAITKADYENIVFIAPFWKDIYTIDNQRIESPEVAQKIDTAIRHVYSNFGYTLKEIPLLPVKQRVDFIITEIET